MRGTKKRGVGRDVLWAAVSCVLLAASAQAANDDAETAKSRADMQQKLDAAQKRLDAAAREVADLSMSMSEDVMPPHVMAFRGLEAKAVLGLTVAAGRRDTRDDGAEVLSVSPGGGAAEAGLRAGDILTEINGESLKRAGDETPGDKVRAAMRDIDAEQKVTVKYLREGKPATATVVAKEPPHRTFNFRLPPPSVAARAGGWPHFAFMRADGLFGSAELVSLTPKLGQYFGSDKGLLVVRAPGDTRLKLEEGDVILDIDGRTPSSPAHALQILTSYEAGEKLKLNVLRMKKRITFDLTIPEDARGSWGRTMPGPPEDVLMPALPGVPIPAPPPGAIIHHDIRSGDDPV